MVDITTWMNLKTFFFFLVKETRYHRVFHLLAGPEQVKLIVMTSVI